ncbi:uncharacterized protein [Argopecten irradians]|uniref:uncharacterized protein n=1 Tax=Argopecten irradians TaxID=31199 RepID=UPI00371F17CA
MMTSTVVAMDHSDVLPSLSLLMPSTPVLLSSKSVIESTAVKTFTVLEAALESLSNRIDQTDSPNQTQLEVYSEELYQHIADNSDVMCSYLREIENIEDQITLKMDALSTDELNTNSTTDWYLRILNLVYGFEANNSGCQNLPLTLELLKLQDAFIKYAKLYMKTENILKTFEHSGTSVIIAMGDLDVLQGEYVTSYGRVVVQPRYFSRRMMSSSKRILMGIFYKETPFDQTQSSDDVSVPVITTFAFDEDGNEIPDINFLMGFPLPTTTSYDNNTINMLPNGTQYMAAIPGGFFNSSPAIVYVNISMMGSCRTYGKYGTTSPTDNNYDFYLHTNKMLSVTQYRPYSLMFSFIGGVIQLPIHQTPVVITVQCQDTSGFHGTMSD